MRKNHLKGSILKFFGMAILCAAVLGYLDEASLGAENTSKQHISPERLSEFSVSHLVAEVPKIGRRVDDLMEESSEVVSKAFRGGGGILAQVNDPVYLAINRFEGPMLNQIKRVAQKKVSVEPLCAVHPVQEKKLIFSGKGFEIADFEKNVDEKLNVDYHYHINFDNRKVFESKPTPSLDLEERDLSSRRSPIFHQAITLMTELEKIESRPNPKQEKQPHLVGRRLPPIPETKVLIHQDPRYLLKLRSDPNAINLLASNEGWNRKLFYGTD